MGSAVRRVGHVVFCVEICVAGVGIFDYENLPDYFNVIVNAGQYVRKPVFVS